VMAPGTRALSLSSQCLRHYNPTVLKSVRHYNVSKLHPIQPPPVTSPLSPYFEPRRMGFRTRLSTHWKETLAPNFLLMRFDPAAKWKQQQLPLRWDGTSPYHKNRPQPRDRHLPRVAQPINARNIPQVVSITVHTMVKSSITRRPDLLNAALAIQSITGKRPELVHSYTPVAVFKLRPRIFPQSGQG
jgi:large subunit ribosomal protein L5